MILVNDGIAHHLTVNEWLHFLEQRTVNADALPESGFIIGPVHGDVARLDLPNEEHDPYEAVLVTENGLAVALTPDQWGAFIEDQVNGIAAPLPEYGADLGEICPALDTLSPIVAKILAAGLRGALADEFECPLPVDDFWQFDDSELAEAACSFSSVTRVPPSSGR